MKCRSVFIFLSVVFVSSISFLACMRTTPLYEEPISYTIEDGDAIVEFNVEAYILDPSHELVFQRGGKTVGLLSWKTGKLQFKGKTEDSAFVFFTHYLKQIVDEYIEKKLNNDVENKKKIFVQEDK